MKISSKGLDLIKSFESLQCKAYKCPAGVWTIGYGHTKDVQPGMVIDEATAIQFLLEDVSSFEETVNSVNLDFNQNQFDALVSFCFNVGSDGFLSSTLLKMAKEDVNNPDIREQFLRWNKSKGKVLAGLTRRREEEVNLYFSKI